MDVKLNNLFESKKGREVFSQILESIEERGILAKIKEGVLVGFSGGPDSVFLLGFLLKLREIVGHFDISLCHVNHMIRAAEADADEEFCRLTANKLDLPFYSFHIDVPKIAKESGKGIEEAARDARYAAFDGLISQRKAKYVSVAHNATDNLETVIFNMMRGAGISGMCGIPSARGNIIRPILSIPKSDVLELLDRAEVEYCIDSTNSSVDYSRNYIRHSVLPLLRALTPSCEGAVNRMVDNLLLDRDYLDSVANEYLGSIDSKGIVWAEFSKLHPAIFARVFSSLAQSVNGFVPERKHILKAQEMKDSDNFSISLPGKTVFRCERGVCSFIPLSEETEALPQTVFPIKLEFGKNIIQGTNLVVFIGDQITKSSLNVYNFSITACVSFDIINDGLYLRLKEDGDAYKYGGFTRKLKKVFNDYKISLSKREKTPVFYDKDGIVFVPGLPVRDGICGNKTVFVTVCFTEDTEKNTLYPIVKSK